MFCLTFFRNVSNLIGDAEGVGMAVLQHKDSISHQTKNCQRCGKILPLNYEEQYCKKCAEEVLFIQVREFIRDNDVTEMEVAEYFNISKSKIKEWIREGRIQHR